MEQIVERRDWENIVSSNNYTVYIHTHALSGIKNFPKFPLLNNKCKIQVDLSSLFDKYQLGIMISPIL